MDQNFPDNSTKASSAKPTLRFRVRPATPTPEPEKTLINRSLPYASVVKGYCYLVSRLFHLAHPSDPLLTSNV